ncbi:Rieske 2Fe-2S domain-containing protein [Pseudomonas sp. RIT-PI-S]|uniref:Rieske 2Fe-2S domain-containing protein n=1 Tax=Pseudomonas sp. RIT-PI-S TaxID=3035295 RepID=UPI0021DAE3DA|nr:Rieske 2Fe-2S domain-containing protein [Pseudomonas sp. RIT-PI-S]
MKAPARWWPVALSQALRNKPLAVQLFDQPLVLFRGETGEPTALPDRCPHRFAPLSAGTVHRGQIQCPYHGWRFADDGRCTRVPGTERPPGSTPLLDRYPTYEAHGLVWASTLPQPPATAPVAPAEQSGVVDAFWMTEQLQCSLTDAAENFLDGFHTHFVHRGWVRHDRQRQRVTARVRPLDDGVEAIYSEEANQAGLISKLLEPTRGISMGRFRLPCLAEIEYRDRKGALTLLASAWLTPCGEQHLQVFIRVATPRGRLPSVLKHFVLRRLFGVILRQDRQILERVSANRSRFAHSPAAPLDAPQDLLGPSIRALVECGQQLVLDEREIELSL